MEHQPSILKEIRPHGTKSFPCAIYRTHSVGKGTLVKHHWHEEVEILYFSGGKFRLEVNMESFPLPSECFCFINPGELHSIITETSDSHFEDAVVFSLGILSFDSYDEAQIHLLRPIQNGKLLFPRFLTPQHPAFVPVRNAFTDIMHSFGQSPAEGSFNSQLVTDNFTSQLYIKASLLYILATLSSHRLFTPTEKDLDKRVESIKTALTYISDNYQNKIYISDLARQVNLNGQYFCRLFKKAIGRSPMAYINEYRIRQAKRLLENTDIAVTEVCLECGFNNLGNFMHEFRRATGTTPLQYRKKS
ncbi:MAG: AraC family transcriptional regulator [Lachnospiraceae bacterium]|nr:AraC family transcriptional regulator [Lachnospiraceae bacterium]MCI9326692.1 AraC family transcriptional regulator [Lachnospiraceae bacterium]